MLYCGQYPKNGLSIWSLSSRDKKKQYQGSRKNLWIDSWEGMPASDESSHCSEIFS